MALSTGYLLHPDMKRFGINDSTLFVPPNPAVYANAASILSAPAGDNSIPSFSDFFGSYFGSKGVFNVTDSMA